MLLRGNKVTEESCNDSDPSSSSSLTAVPLQVVKVKNSRGGQEGSGGPGATAAQGPQTRLPLLFRNLGESPGKGATVEGRGGVLISDSADEPC